MKTLFENLKSWEKGLLTCAALLNIAAGGLWISGFSFANYFFFLDDNQEQLQVGKLDPSSGKTRRKSLGEIEFRELPGDSPIFSHDVILTSDDSGATIDLNEGHEKLKLAPDTLVELKFEQKLAIGGINRTLNVEVATGSVTDEGKNTRIRVHRSERPIVLAKRTKPKSLAAPKPSPTAAVAIKRQAKPDSFAEVSPTLSRVELVGPVNTVFRVPDQSPAAEIPTEFRARIPASIHEVTFRLLCANGQARESFEKKILIRDRRFQLPLLLKHPGSYVWQLEEPAREGAKTRPVIYAKAAFSVLPDFEALKLGQVKAAHSTALRDTELLFSWDYYSKDPAYYTVEVYSDAAGRRLIGSASSVTNQAEISQKIVSADPFYYRVHAKLMSGFVVRSPIQHFSTKLLPPVLSAPVDQSRVSVSMLVRDEDAIIFVWRKSPTWKKYEIRIARDPDFKRIIRRKTLSSTYFKLNEPEEGNYYWTVEGLTGKERSGPSAVSSVLVTP